MTAEHSSEEGGEGLREAEWHEGGDGHGYGYQYIGPIHYLCECGAYFLNRDGWVAHKATVPIEAERDDLRGRLAAVEALADSLHDDDVEHRLRAALANPSAAQGEGEAE